MYSVICNQPQYENYLSKITSFQESRGWSDHQKHLLCLCICTSNKKQTTHKTKNGIIHVQVKHILKSVGLILTLALWFDFDPWLLSFSVAHAASVTVGKSNYFVLPGEQISMDCTGSEVGISYYIKNR